MGGLSNGGRDQITSRDAHSYTQHKVIFSDQPSGEDFSNEGAEVSSSDSARPHRPPWTVTAMLQEGGVILGGGREREGGSERERSWAPKEDRSASGLTNVPI